MQETTPKASDKSSDTAAVLAARQIGRRVAQQNGWLFRNLSLEIRAGDRLAVVGPTGAGKTLLLRSLALLDPLDAGVILWNGVPVASGMVPQFRSQVIYLHQRAVLFPGTVEDNLRQPLGLRVHRGTSFDHQRVLRLLAETNRNPSFLARSDRDLSGGERQIVALVRAIQLDPALLLLDEPTAALDAESTRAIEAIVSRWLSEAQGRCSTVWVSHNAEQVRRVAERVLRMEDGRLHEEP